MVRVHRSEFKSYVSRVRGQRVSVSRVVIRV